MITLALYFVTRVSVYRLLAADDSFKAFVKTLDKKTVKQRYWFAGALAFIHFLLIVGLFTSSYVTHSGQRYYGVLQMVFAFGVDAYIIYRGFCEAIREDEQIAAGLIPAKDARNDLETGQMTQQ